MNKTVLYVDQYLITLLQVLFITYIHNFFVKARSTYFKFCDSECFTY